MAIGGTIYGTIEVVWGVPHPHLRRHNVRVLQHLPRQDEWPPLIGKMFGMTGPTAREGAFENDLIHFGATLKGLDAGEAAAWILKFESLLRRLYWFGATMHIEWIFGNREFHWSADPDQVHRFVRDGVVVPPNRWTFDDGGQPLAP